MLLILPVGDVNPRKSIPVVNYLLLAANLFVFFYFFLFERGAYARVVRAYGLTPVEFQNDLAQALLGGGWKLVTSLFLHGGVAHLVGNMLFLWIAGDNVEDKLGHVKYLFFYLLSGVVANVGHIAMAVGPSAYAPCVGASGAIAGVLGAYVIWFPRRRIRIWYFCFFLMGTFTVPSLYAIGFWFIQQLYLGKMTASGFSGVAYWAHIGGFMFGALAALAGRIAKAPARRSHS